MENYSTVLTVVEEEVEKQPRRVDPPKLVEDVLSKMGITFEYLNSTNNYSEHNYAISSPLANLKNLVKEILYPLMIENILKAIRV